MKNIKVLTFVSQKGAVNHGDVVPGGFIRAVYGAEYHALSAGLSGVPNMVVTVSERNDTTYTVKDVAVLTENESAIKMGSDAIPVMTFSQSTQPRSQISSAQVSTKVQVILRYDDVPMSQLGV